MAYREEDPSVHYLPPNFIEKWKLLGGSLDIRNAIEAGILLLGVGLPVFHIPLTLTVRIIIFCLTALPLALLALIGIAGESLSAFLLNALRFLFSRRKIYRSDILPDTNKKKGIRRGREHKAKPAKKKKERPDKPEPELIKKKKCRAYDFTTKKESVKRPRMTSIT